MPDVTADNVAKVAAAQVDQVYKALLHVEGLGCTADQLRTCAEVAVAALAKVSEVSCSHPSASVDARLLDKDGTTEPRLRCDRCDVWLFSWDEVRAAGVAVAALGQPDTAPAEPPSIGDLCICDAAYSERGLLDPRCRHDDLEDLVAERDEARGQAARLREAFLRAADVLERYEEALLHYHRRHSPVGEDVCCVVNGSDATWVLARAEEARALAAATDQGAGQ